MLDKDQVKHIAKLARLGISESEVKKFQKELSLILDFVSVLQKVDVAKTKPMAQATESLNVFRKDEISSSQKNKQFRRQFLKNLPDKKQGYLKVPSVLE